MVPIALSAIVYNDVFVSVLSRNRTCLSSLSASASVSLSVCLSLYSKQPAHVSRPWPRFAVGSQQPKKTSWQ